MKIILLYVSSVDGKLTRWGQPHVQEWASKEDVEHFAKIKTQNKLIVLGSNTYDVVRPEPQPGTLRVILTRNPEKYQENTVPGQIEFTNESPEELVIRLEKQYKQMLLLSGKTLTTEFLKKRLVNELWLTIEPKLFGSGDSMLTDEKLHIQLQLISVKQLNAKGTLLVKYKVENDC